MNFYNWDSIERIALDIYIKGIPGSEIQGDEWESYVDLAFNVPEWEFLEKEQKFILIRHRQLLIKRGLDQEEMDEFIILNEEIEFQELDNIIWPIEYNTFEKFIINLIFKKEFVNGKSFQREFDRGRNSLLS
jgi:hypothetical protein